jgi:FlaA1/EpsC-like NDP-sugar epimerase
VAVARRSGRAAGVEEIIRDRTVLITGGGGSIGSELARQVFALGPRRLILVDRAESPLYLVQRDLETQRSHKKGSGELRIHLANVASRAAMERMVAAEAPNVIFHAAAYKHVPMMEEHPSDATYVNIGGTLVLLDAAAAAGVERFVFVSTDKAVRPSSVMGASKRIAEMLVADTARRTGRPYVSVRFGNVLGSTGSVVPIFQEQLENGEPLTVTHPDMTRFFMTIPDVAIACSCSRSPARPRAPRPGPAHRGREPVAAGPPPNRRRPAPGAGARPVPARLPSRPRSVQACSGCAIRQAA